MDSDEVFEAMTHSRSTFPLQLKVFGGGLDHQLSPTQLTVVGGEADAPQGRFGNIGRHRLLDHLTLQILAHGRDAALQRSVGNVQQRNVKTGHRAHLRDAVAHGPRADHGDVMHAHQQPPYTRSKMTAMP
jgi:hypothetical protein